MSAKFEFIDAEKADFPIVKMCEWVEVSTSGYYEWRDRPASATAIRREHLTSLVKAVFEQSDQTYGYRRVHAQLIRQGEQVSPELVRELMRDLGLVACQPRPYRPTTTVPGDPGPIPDLVNRHFTAQAPGQKMVGDITYIPTWEGWLYLATVIDCCTKACIRIRHGRPPPRRTSDRRADHGRPELPSHRGRDIPLRSRYTIYQRGVRGRGEPPRHPAIGRGHRRMFRQRPRRIIQRRSESRASQPHRLPYP